MTKKPEVELTLAFNPSARQIDKIMEWFWDNFQQKVALKISVDEEVIAGACLAFDGRIWDYTLGKKIDEPR